jgi:hypothetical protein
MVEKRNRSIQIVGLEQCGSQILLRTRHVDVVHVEFEPQHFQCLRELLLGVIDPPLGE